MMFVRFNIKKYIEREFSQDTYAQLVDLFPGYNVEWRSSTEFSFRKRAYLSKDYGKNMLNAMNFILYFKVMIHDNKAVMDIEISHLSFSILVLLFGGTLFFLTKYNPTVIDLIILLSIFCCILLYASYTRVKSYIREIMQILD